MLKLNSKQLRDIPVSEAKEHAAEIVRKPIYLILENIYDTYNIGGLFRLADAMAVPKIYICGDSETPPNHKIQKASVGTYKIVPWEYKPSAVDAINELRANPKSEIRNSKQIRNTSFQNSNSKLSDTSRATRPQRLSVAMAGVARYTLRVYAIEQSEKSVPYTSVDYQMPVALVVGNESTGMTEETLAAVDQIVEIPMWGINKSLNVIVSAGIVGYHIISNFKLQNSKLG